MGKSQSVDFITKTKFSSLSIQMLEGAVTGDLGALGNGTPWVPLAFYLGPGGVGTCGVDLLER